MTRKNKTLSVRIEEFRYDFLREFTEENDMKITDLQRTHLEQVSRGTEPESDLDADEAYRELTLQLQDGDVESLDEFVEENYGYPGDFGSEDAELDFSRAMEGLVLYAEEEEYGLAEEVIDEWRAEGNSREAFLMDKVLDRYRE